jgi:nucleoside-diphosphate-sugar epimerase
MRILITGHKGFVGRHFMKKFENQGHEILGIDLKGIDAINYKGKNHSSNTSHDCRDYFKKSTDQFDLVIHLAAIVGGRATIEGEPLSVATDLSIDAEMFNWVVRTKQPRVVYFSSSAAYPTKLQGPGANYKLKESDIDLENVSNPDFTYGWAKLTGEYLAQFAQKAGIKVYIFRPFSGYGEDQDLDYPFPSFIKRVADRMDPFVIWGDGTQVRDFIHMDDICDSVMEVVEKDLPTPLNLGTGIPTSFNELAELMLKIDGWRPSKIVHLTDKPAGVMYRCCEPTEFLKVYQPKISLESGIKMALDHYRKNNV